MPELLAAIDQGTTSTRAVIFDAEGRELGSAQLTHRQHYPRPGWVEHDPEEILENTRHVLAGALAAANATPADLAALGIANQRETTVVWDRHSGRPLAPAIVWQDTRSAAALVELDGALLRARTGLPPATYFSSTKLAWLLENIPGARAAGESGDALFGTLETFLLWQLSRGALHVTDVTNVSRTQLLDLEALSWSPEILDLFGVPPAMLASVLPSIGNLGTVWIEGASRTAEVPVAAALGDQQAAMVGHGCFAVGDAKCTYGTGTFLLANTGRRVVRSHSGLLSTVCYQRAGEPAAYALEGSIAVSGSAISWLRDQLGLVATAEETAALAATVPDGDGVVFVPAFSGLFAPTWRPDVRGALFGLTAAHTCAHVVRATLEAICQQVRDLTAAMAADLGSSLGELRVDGGVSRNDVCMQLQADVLGVPVRRAATAEVTALGAARAAGLGVGLATADGFGTGSGEVFAPGWTPQQRASAVAQWRRAVAAACGFADSAALSDTDGEAG